MANYVKREENAGKSGYLIGPGDENKINTMKKDVGLDGEEGGDTGAPKRVSYENLKPNTDMTNDSLCNITSARNIDNGNVTNTETKSITNDESNNGEVAEAEAEAEIEAEADINSKKLNSSSNTGIVSSSNSNNEVDNNILKRPDKNKKTIENNVGNDGDKPCETRETQQQKMWKCDVNR